MKEHIGNDDIHYRRMTAEDLPAARQLSLSVLWPHRLDDWKFILEVCVGFVAEDASGVVGTVVCAVHGKQFASLGMMIVAPARQRQGVGRELAARALKEVGDRSVLLHGSLDGLALCEEHGFRVTGKIHQHQGSVFRAPFVALGAGERIRPVSSRDEATLIDLASRAAGMPRGTVLKHLLSVANCVAIDRYGELIGFAALRKFGLGHVIGPVVAPDIEHAKALIAHWAGSYASSFVRVDVPGWTELSPWLADMGLMLADHAVPAMTRGEAPSPDATIRQFALISQTLG